MSSASLPLTTLALALVATFATTHCGSSSEELEAVESAASVSRFRETAPWTGRLILPSRTERKPDGAVKLEVHNSPIASLRGKTVWLHFARTADVQDRVRGVTRDVLFNEAARAGVAKGNVHPVRIDGWKNVGPLESLAGARMEDDVLVALPAAHAEGDGIVIAREPVMIVGDLVGLVRIKEPQGQGYKIIHYEKAARAFTGPEETIAFDAPAIPVGGNGPTLSPVQGIETASANLNGGYYAHAVRSADGALHVRGLVPRQLRDLPSAGARTGASASAHYTTDEMWASVANAVEGSRAKGTLSSTLLVPNDTGERWDNESLHEGARLLVVHTFGAIGPSEDGPLRTGHFSFGVATVVTEPLTGERALDIEYKQVYAHSPNGIISGSHDYASYAGSFARGWMYSRPIADVALYWPALDREYSLGGTARLGRPIDALAFELEAMTAHYRTGLGTGASIVTPANSCVQDSSKALYFALEKLREKTSQPALKAFLDAHPTDPEVQDFNALSLLANKVEAYLSPLGFIRADWKEQAKRVAATDVTACPGGMVGAVACGLESYNTIFPRAASDFYTEALIDAGAGGVALRSNQVGGAMPNMIPLSPTTPLRVLKVAAR